MKAATFRQKQKSPGTVISIHAAREGGDPALAFLGFFLIISIHAAREGGDVPDGQEIADFFGISIHAAREGGDA